MLAENKLRLLRDESVTLITDDVRELRETLALLIAHQNFRGRDTHDLIFQRSACHQLCDTKFARRKVRIREAEPLALRENCGHVIRPLGLQHIELAHRACADDLRNIARNNFARLRLARLITHRHAFPGLDQLRDVIMRCVIRHPAHRHAVAFSQRHVQQP